MLNFNRQFRLASYHPRPCERHMFPHLASLLALVIGKTRKLANQSPRIAGRAQARIHLKQRASLVGTVNAEINRRPMRA